MRLHRSHREFAWRHLHAPLAFKDMVETHVAAGEWIGIRKPVDANADRSP